MNFRENCSGFGLIEVIIASGLMITVLTGFSILFVNMQKNQNRLQARQDFNTLSSQIRNLVENDASCASVFSGAPFSPTNGKANLNRMTLPGGVRIQSTRSLPDHFLHINSMSFRNISAAPIGRDVSGNNVYSVDLFIDSKTLRHVPGDGEMGERSIASFFVQENGGRVVDCGGTNMSINSPDLRDLCRSLGGAWVRGTCETPAARVCRSLGGTWASGRCETPAVARLCRSLGGTWRNNNCSGVGGNSGGGSGGGNSGGGNNQVGHWRPRRPGLTDLTNWNNRPSCPGSSPNGQVCSPTGARCKRQVWVGITTTFEYYECQ